MAFTNKDHARLESADGTMSTQPPTPPTPPTPPPENPIQRVATKDNPDYPKGVKLASILIALFLALFCVSLDRTIIATAIPKITTDFNSLGDIGWYGSSYLLTSACFQLAFGRMYAEFSIKWIFLTAVVIFEVGSIVCATAPNSPALIVGRAIAGLGTAGVATGALTILAHCLPLHQRPKFTGIMGAAMGISQVVGPTIGGAFADHATWRWCFWLNLPIGGITIPIIVFYLNLPSQARVTRTATVLDVLRRFDFMGTVLIMPSIVALLLALQWGGTTYSWSSWRIILLLVVFAVCFVAWVGVQLYEGDNATLPLRLVRQRSLAAAMFYMFCVMGFMFQLTYYVPVWFQAVLNVSAEQSGVDILAMTIPTAVCALSAGFITSSVGYYNPLMLACTVLGSVSCGMIFRFYIDTSTGYWIGSLILFGISFGLGGQQSLMVPQTVLQGRDIALGTSAMIFMQTMSGTIFLSVAQNLFEADLVKQLKRRVPSVDSAFVVDSGAANIQATMSAVYSPSEVDEIVVSYAVALQKVFLLSLILACLSVFGSATLEWRNVKKKGALRGSAANKAETGEAGVAASDKGQSGEEMAAGKESQARASAKASLDEGEETELSVLPQTQKSSVQEEAVL